MFVLVGKSFSIFFGFLGFTLSLKMSQVSKKKAKKLLKTKVFINIFDLLEGKYEKRTTKKLLIQDMIDNPERIFPLKFAKGGAFQYFLQNIREEI
jgi:hypothetical protein